MIELVGIHKKFGKLVVLDGVSFEHKPGGMLTILGPNGSGKTTLIKTILGMVLPERGEIKFDDEVVNGRWEYRNHIDYLPQIARFPDNLSVKELINMVKQLRKKESRDEELISLFKLEGFLQKKLGNLSGGTRQKVNLALAFMFDSPLIILDEPTSGLDPVSLINLKELIKSEKERGKTFLVTTHILNFVEEMSDEIVFLLEGKIYFKGSVEELKTRTSQSDLEHAIANVLEVNHV